MKQTPPRAALLVMRCCRKGESEQEISDRMHGIYGIRSSKPFMVPSKTVEFGRLLGRKIE
jgi:hypothetical protein